MGLWDNIEDIYWDMVDGAIKGTFGFVIAMALAYFIKKYTAFPLPLVIGIMFFIMLFISVLLSKLIKVHLGYFLRGRYYNWLGKISQKNEEEQDV
jgi:uncharacterized membrane protein